MEMDMQNNNYSDLSKELDFDNDFNNERENFNRPWCRKV